MNPEKQRIAIAEACGWKFELEPSLPLFGYKTPNQSDCGFCCDFINARGSSVAIRSLTGLFQHACVPDYLNDFNAMHEAEEKLNNSVDADKYGKALADAVLGYHGTDETITLNHWALMRVARATAAERAEDFLRTLGKWEEDT